jgi:putative NADH-flavin reductase
VTVDVERETVRRRVLIDPPLGQLVIPRLRDPKRRAVKTDIRTTRAADYDDRCVLDEEPVKDVPIVGERLEESTPRFETRRLAANLVAGRVDERVVIGHQPGQTGQITVVDVLVERDGKCSRVHSGLLSMISPRCNSVVTGGVISDKLPLATESSTEVGQLHSIGPTSMNKIALLSAAGAIGHSIAKAVSAQGAPYRVVGRSRDALAAAFGADSLAEIVTWNPDDPASVQAAAAGVDAIVYLVGVNYWQFELHPRLMKQTLDGAIAAGVNRIVLIGTVYPYGRPRTRPVREDHPREPLTFKGRMRKAQEDLLLAAHAEGKIQATVLRLPDFYGPGVGKSFLHSGVYCRGERRRCEHGWSSRYAA